MKDDNNGEDKKGHVQPDQEGTHSGAVATNEADDDNISQDFDETFKNIKCEFDDKKKTYSQQYEEEVHFGPDDNSASEDANDCSQDFDESTHFQVYADPLIPELAVTKETNKIASTSQACPPPIVDHVKDEHQMAGQVIGTKLKNMELQQQIIAEKLISDVLYYGRLGMLEIDTRLQNLKISPM
jgi:hypothetical protein